MLLSLYKYTSGKILLAALLMIMSSIMMAGIAPQKIYITGQVTSIEFGNSINKHPILVESYDNGLERYYKELVTDEEGYYHDTILTTKSNGSFNILTYDHNGKRLDTTVYFRFMAFAVSDVLIANFRISTPFHPPFFQARFEYVQKDNGNRRKFKFIDLTESEHIIGWHWNFGDGDTSINRYPVHTYTENGIYKVRLTVTYNYYGHLFTSIISKVIHISEKSFYHMGGHAFTEYFPVDYGLAFLYSVDSAYNYIPVDTVSIDTLGYYIFYQIPVGNYVIKVQPQHSSDHYGEMLPTYFGDVVFWEQAEIINFNETDWEYDVWMQHGKGMLSGACLVSGNVIYNDPVNSILDSPAERVDILLYDEENQLLGSHYSNEYGLFDFSDLSTGTYWICPEVTGINSDRLKVDLSFEEPNAIGIEIVLGPSSPEFIFDNASRTDMIGKVYPNPSKSIINIEYKTEDNNSMTLQLSDLEGRVLYTETIQPYTLNDRITLDVKDFKSGSYIIKLSNGKNFSSRLFMKN